MRLQEEVHEQPLDGLPVMADAVIAPGRARRRVLEPVQGRLAGQGRAIGAAGLELAGKHRHDGIVPDLVVVDQILVAQSNPEHALADQGCDLMLEALGIARR